jgi:predicted flap endonuclease-1-like 5' DNA nuclease
MGTTIPGGRYQTANGRWVDAHGQPVDPPPKSKKPQPAAGATPRQPAAEPPAGAGPSADDLTVIVGIGQTMQERLNLAGIRTYAELVSAELSQIAAATRANENIIKAWRNDALALYESQQETGIVEADDLTEIDGIGPARSRELELKNITRFEDLARADPEWLHATMEVSRTMIEEWQAEAGRLANS